MAARKRTKRLYAPRPQKTNKAKHTKAHHELIMANST
jgi:hypothetical protein